MTERTDATHSRVDAGAVRDAAARHRVLADLDASLLVEAAAGTGKTSLLAARVTMLLMRGVDPYAIAAITFTEAAASELAQRVHTYVAELLGGTIPLPLWTALPDGLGEVERAHLRAAAGRLDGLATATIHGFCQVILSSYAVEADIDPGAEVIDAELADALFGQVFDAWLTRRLSGTAAANDPVLLLTRADPLGVVELLREVAAMRRRHPTARVPAADIAARPDLDLADAIDTLKRWYASVPDVAGATAFIEEMEAVGLHFAGCFAGPLGFDRLWQLAHPESSPRMVRGGFALRRPNIGAQWLKATGAETGTALGVVFLEGFDRIDAAYREVLAALSLAIAGQLSDELDGLLADYAAAKRAAAVFDFDDLLLLAVDLLRGHPAVRAALAERFRHLLVDEFQDTDLVQCDIIFRIAGRDHAQRWQDVPQRPGGLFLVGDPKQSLFLFRGAAIESYNAAKAVIAANFPENILDVTSNFRTIEPILTHVNNCFETALEAPGQPGYVALGATRKDPVHDLPCTARIPVELSNQPRLREIREAEADAVAKICARLVGGLDLKQADGSTRKVRPGDIALLAPVGVDLWIYERALQQCKLPFASKAGKGFYRRQEVQDLVCLTRLLADPDDTLALGAFLRGPLAGFTDEALLDAALALPRGDDVPSLLSLRTPAEDIADPDLRRLIETLRALRARAFRTTPAQLLTEAAERLSIRAILARREPRRASAANANVDVFLQRANAYAVRGLRRFAQDMSEAWRSERRVDEGRVDAEGEAIDIVSIHSAKGLEWPIVILVNMASSPRGSGPIVHRATDDTLHWTVGGVASPTLAEALRLQADELARERARLLYVGCTRARDLLILPQVAGSSPDAYSRAVDLDFAALPLLDLGSIGGARAAPYRGPANGQDAELFAVEAARIAAASVPIEWLRPSCHDGDRSEWEDVDADDGDAAGLAAAPAIDGAGRLRGLLMHKLIEEILGDALPDDLAAVATRAEILLGDLAAAANGGALPDPAEVAATAIAALALPDIMALRPSLVPEMPVYATVDEGGGPMPLAGRIDALVVEDGVVTAVIDWKSDVAPGDAERHAHVEQLRLYLAATGTSKGALVYASLGAVRWVYAPDARPPDAGTA